MANDKTEGCHCISPDTEAPTGAVLVTPGDMHQTLTRYAHAVKNGEPSLPMFIYGAPGIGKTEIVNQVGKEANMKVYTFIASTMDPSDVRGLPYPNVAKEYASWFPPKEFKSTEVDQPAIYFFVTTTPTTITLKYVHVCIPNCSSIFLK